MGWFESVKKYVWNDHTTPYLVPVPKLSQFQARKELFVYTYILLIGSGLAVLLLFSAAKGSGDLLSVWWAMYALALLAAVILLAATQSSGAAQFCVSAPVLTMVAVLAGHLRPESPLPERVVIMLLAAIWLRYSLRVAAMAKALPDMPEQPDASG